MGDWVRTFGDYMPHGMCLLWQPWLIILWAGADLLIFLSYMAIPVALITVLKKRGDIKHRGLIALFASFILLCGLTHLMGIVTLWYPIYPITAWVKLATGLVSATTAVVLFRLIPTLLAIPSPARLEAANAQLAEEVAAHERTLASLEEQVRQRTSDLETATSKLAVQTREAVHRSGNLLSVVSALARETAKSSKTKDEFLEALSGRIHALAGATASVQNSETNTSRDLEAIIRNRVDALVSKNSNRIRIEGAPLQISSEAAQQISLAIHELMTNSVKYGLRSDDDLVSISWKIVGDSDKSKFEFDWREKTSGGRDVDERIVSSTGFGSKLLLRIVPQVLKGSAERERTRDGFEYRLTVPLDSIVAPEDLSADEQLAARLIDDSFSDM